MYTAQQTLRNPKTSKMLPYQVVEIPETGNFLFPVQALDAWVGTRNVKPIGVKPLFAYQGGGGAETSHTKVH